MTGLPRFRDDDRVTVIDTHDRHYGEHGTVDGWHYGMAGGFIYHVRLDHREDALPYAQEELQLGEEVFTR